MGVAMTGNDCSKQREQSFSNRGLQDHTVIMGSEDNRFACISQVVVICVSLPQGKSYEK